jgi:transposase
MHGPRAPRVRLSPPVRKRLKRIVKNGKSEHRLVVRARIALLAAQGENNASIARQVGRSVRTVRRWRQRLATSPTANTLRDRPRGGRPASVPIAARVYIGMLACTDPNTFDLPRTTWSQEALLQVLRSTTGWSMSRSEVCRTLASIEIKPHRFRQWLHSPDPEFQTKVARICELYQRAPKDAVVLCVDEKPGIQALQRLFPTHLAGLGGEQRREFEYVRHGTQALMAALNVRTGQVLGQVFDQRTGDNLVSFMERIARHFSGRRVIVIWDNLNTHYDGKDARWTRFNARHGGRFSFVYTPKHASWTNQVELWFSILERQLLKHGDFASVSDLRSAIERFIRHYNAHQAKPFRWTFRGHFGHDHPRVHRGATVRRCRRTRRSTKTKHGLSKTSFKSMALSTFASAAVAHC